MKFIDYVVLCCGALFLSACEEPEVDFCKRWIASAFDEETQPDWQKVGIDDRPLTPLEAQQTVFPNYDPNAFYKRRPDNIPNLIYALGVVPAELRIVNVHYDITDESGQHSYARSCEFLRLSETSQHITEADFFSFAQRRRTGNGDDTCCIKKNEEVR